MNSTLWIFDCGESRVVSFKNPHKKVNTPAVRENRLARARRRDARLRLGLKQFRGPTSLIDIQRQQTCYNSDSVIDCKAVSWFSFLLFERVRVREHRCHELWGKTLIPCRICKKLLIDLPQLSFFYEPKLKSFASFLSERRWNLPLISQHTKRRSQGHTRTPAPRSSQDLTHAHSHITRALISAVFSFWDDGLTK